jgi:hypothetical protein
VEEARQRLSRSPSLRAITTMPVSDSTACYSPRREAASTRWISEVPE